MRSRTIVLVLVVLGLVGAATWYVAQETPPSEPPTVLDGLSASERATDERPGAEPLAAAETAGPILVAGDRPAPAPAAEASTADTAEGVGDILYTGKVLDASGGPAAGATVEVRWRGEVLREVTTDAQGGYRFRTSLQEANGRSNTGAVIARGPNGDVGCAWVWLGASQAWMTETVPNERTVGDVALQPAVALDVAVSSSCDGGLPATVWLAAIDMGSHEVIAKGQTDAAGLLTLSGLPNGRWRLVAAAPGCGRDTALVQLPRREHKAIELDLPEARSLQVVVREKGNQKPIAGAKLAVEEYVRLPNQHGRGHLISVPSAYVTDERGIVVIAGLGTKEKLTLRVSADGFPTGEQPVRRRRQGYLVVRAPETTATIELSRPRTIRWPIEDEGRGIPPDGTVVVLKPYVNSGMINIPISGIVEKGAIVVGGWAPGFASALAYAQGFGAARLQTAPDQSVGSPAVFHPVRKIELFAKRADGSPAEGVFLFARGPGNNLLAPGVRTDAGGYAILKDMYGGQWATADCSVAKTAQGFPATPLGRVDLKTQDGRFEFTLPSERTLRLSVTIEGKPAPAGLTGQGRFPQGGVALKTDATGLCEATFTPPQATGELVLHVTVAGYLASGPAKGSLDGPDPIELSVDLVRTGSAVIKVLLPKDGRNSITPQAFDAEKGEWIGHVAANSHAFAFGASRADVNGMLTFPNLRPGRYRAVDSYSGAKGPPFEIVAGAEPTHGTLDLSKSGWATGKVVPPPGVPVSGFTVGRDGEKPNTAFRMAGSSGGQSGRPVNPKDGTFAYRVSGDESVTLRIYHLTCVPHATKGRVTVTGPREGIELHAAVGVKASVRFEKPLRMFINPGRRRTVQVRLYQGAARGAGLALTGLLNKAGDGVEFGGYTPGTYTVWIDTITAAPLVLEDVQLGAGDTDLGTHATSVGSTLRIHLKVKPGQSAPRMYLSANRLGDPTYMRRTNAPGPTIVLSGLGPGRFRVSGSAPAGAGGIDEEITFDGKGDVERTIDLR